MARNKHSGAGVHYADVNLNPIEIGQVLSVSRYVNLSYLPTVFSKHNMFAKPNV